MKVDWNAEALGSAENYLDTMAFSYNGLYDQLTSEYGEQYTPEQARYAVDTVKADWNAEALESAKNYQKEMNMSPEAIRDQLTSEYGEQFTPEQAEYAIANL
ncbi:Ltp family lipoprotein [Rothia terrae]|uniref:Ltp family lipoprotein n=1 Tax=Rothia terrae TaxID=396015 RepID=UPI001D13DF93|nr:Ltp family lipoprotein [Rothia terrae]